MVWALGGACLSTPNDERLNKEKGEGRKQNVKKGGRECGGEDEDEEEQDQEQEQEAEVEAEAEKE